MRECAARAKVSEAGCVGAVAGFRQKASVAGQNLFNVPASLTAVPQAETSLIRLANQFANCNLCRMRANL